MFGILESVYVNIRLYTYYIYMHHIYIYIISLLWTVSKARSRFDVPVCHYVTVLFSPKCDIILELYHKSITHQTRENLNQQVLPFEKPGGTRTFVLVNQRVEPNSRLHGAFASDFECEMSARYEAYAENDVPWMVKRKDFWKKNASHFGKIWGMWTRHKELLKDGLVGTKILFNKD